MIFIEFFEKGNSFYIKQNYLRAIEVYNKAIKNKDNEIAAMHNMALCYIKLNQQFRSIPLLRLVAAKSPTSTHFFNLAYAYYSIKDFKKALVYFNKAWAISPENKDCEVMINYILKIYKRGSGIDKLV